MSIYFWSGIIEQVIASFPEFTMEDEFASGENRYTSEMAG